jgi:hypothetical protein
MIKNSLGSSDCSKADISIVADSVYTCYEPNNITIIQIKKGTSTTNVSKLIFYLSSGGNMIKYTREVSLSGAGLSVYAFNSSKISKVDRIGVVPVVGKKECSAVYAEEVFPCGSEEVVEKDLIEEEVVCQTAATCPTKECKTSTCISGVCGLTGSSVGTSCNSGAGKCNSSGVCVACLANVDCPTQQCKTATCNSGSCQYTLLSSCDLLYENFDGEVNGWSHRSLGGDDGWHISSSNCAGNLFASMAYGTNGNGCSDFSLLDYSILVGPEIFLNEDYSAFELTFNSFANDEGGTCLSCYPDPNAYIDVGGYGDNYDRKDAGVSLDGGLTWQALNNGPLNGYLDGIWFSKSFDVSSYKGQTIRPIFAYNTQDPIAGAGWYVDDVKIRGSNG